VIELPTYTLTNDLDKRILAELNKTLIEVDGHLQNYILDEATKSAMDFMDKLTNRRLRRSRRRFRANGMNEDKHSAYATLFYVLKRYLQILAPFTPFITEYLRLQLADFTNNNESRRDGSLNRPDALTMRPYADSIHLSSRPIANEHYINQPLIEETATVRKIIKLALFVRAKNKIAVKQPLQKLEIKIS
jgi:isoleucyl-tRNA synthetase